MVSSGCWDRSAALGGFNNTYSFLMPGGQEAQDQGASRWASGEATSCLAGTLLLPVSWHGGQDEGLSGDPSLWALIPVVGLHPHELIYSQRPHLFPPSQGSQASTNWGVGVTTPSTSAWKTAQILLTITVFYYIPLNIFHHKMPCFATCTFVYKSFKRRYDFSGLLS